MNDYYKCFCNEEYDLAQMKTHFKKCYRFKNEFDDLEKILSNSIKKFVDKLNSSDQERFINGLFLLKFFLKRYVNLIAQKINNNIKESHFIMNRAKNNIKINNTNLDFKKFVSFDIPKKQVIEEKNKLRLTMYKNNNEFQNKKSKDKTFNTIREYCEEVFENDSNFNQDDVNVMSYVISSLTYRKCFLGISNQNFYKELAKSCDEDHKVYCFECKGNYILVVLC